MTDLQPGSVPARFDYLLKQLKARFPDAISGFSSASHEHAYLASIDQLILQASMNSLVTLVRGTSELGDEFNKERTSYSVLAAIMSEVGETSEEIAIMNGDSYKNSGPDGVIGEALDAIIALLDLIYVVDPTITEARMYAIARPKCDKWIEKLKVWAKDR